ncbi:hypothetical protein BN871_AN_00250 [Paenibacillus sp. P22]|nr:hypothetical protein BN871_AN_00250 [Paenibacillus sp. P22]
MVGGIRHGADTERGEEGSAVVISFDAARERVAVLDGGWIARRLRLDPAVHFLELAQCPAVPAEEIVGRDPPWRPAGVVVVIAVLVALQEVGRSRLVGAAGIDDEVGKQACRGAVVRKDRIDDGISLVRHLVPAGVARRGLERLEMVQHEVGRPRRRRFRAARRPVAEAQRPARLVHVALHDRIDDRLGRGQIVDRSRAAPLAVGQQQRVGDVHIPVRGGIGAFDVLEAAVLLPGHERGIVRARMGFVVGVQAVEIRFGAAVRTRHEHRQQHAVAMGLGYRFAGVVVFYVIFAAARRLQVIALPGIPLALDGAVHGALRDVGRLDGARRIGGMLRERPAFPGAEGDSCRQHDDAQPHGDKRSHFRLDFSFCHSFDSHYIIPPHSRSSCQRSTSVPWRTASAMPVCLPHLLQKGPAWTAPAPAWKGRIAGMLPSSFMSIRRAATSIRARPAPASARAAPLRRPRARRAAAPPPGVRSPPPAAAPSSASAGTARR